jgi:hypothetical protein
LSWHVARERRSRAAKKQVETEHGVRRIGRQVPVKLISGRSWKDVSKDSLMIRVLSGR